MSARASRCKQRSIWIVYDIQKKDKLCRHALRLLAATADRWRAHPGACTRLRCWYFTPKEDMPSDGAYSAESLISRVEALTRLVLEISGVPGMRWSPFALLVVCLTGTDSSYKAVSPAEMYCPHTCANCSVAHTQIREALGLAESPRLAPQLPSTSWTGADSACTAVLPIRRRKHLA